MNEPALTILLPCHSLEDFPVHHSGPDADNLLSAWTVLWHPALIAAAKGGPQWRRADDPPAELAGHVLAVPDVATRELPAGFLQRARTEGAVVLRGGTRETMLALALEALPCPAELDHDLALDFMALGYCFLQVELLTRQMRYASNLDEIHFRHQLLEGAEAAVAGDAALAREKLALCYSLLSEERDHYYSVDVYLLDITMVADTTLGHSLRDEMQLASATNLLIRGNLLARVAREHPDTLEAIQHAIRDQRCCLIGGEDEEHRLPLLDLESVAASLRRGARWYEQHVGQRPSVFGRRRSGLGPLLPQILALSGFTGALHASFDGGRVPIGSQLKTRWEGPDGTAIDAVARPPLDASDAGTFLGLARRLGETMDMDHVAALVMAHWPRQASRWHDELRRVARHTPALGRFYRLDSFFRDTMMPGRLDRFEARQYRQEYLKPQVIRREENPISRVVRYWQNVAQRRVCDALRAWSKLLAPDTPPDVPLPDAGTDEQPAASELFAGAVEEAVQQWVTRLGAGGGEQLPTRVLVNPFPASRRVLVEMDAASLPPLESPVVDADVRADGRGQVVVEIPACGFATLPQLPTTTPPRKRKKRRPLVDELTLGNEFFEARVHPETGALVSVRSYEYRGNLLSQQLAFRLPWPSGGNEPEPEERPYTRMVAESINVISSSAVAGEIESRGVLLHPDGREVARFRQRAGVVRGGPVLRLDIELEPFTEPRADPWNSYYACRFAWGDDSAVVSRSLQETRQRVESGRFESPHFVEIDNGHVRVAVLTGGLPFHRFVGYRKLDSLLIVRGESERRFRMGIAVNVPHPTLEASELLATAAPLRYDTPFPMSRRSGWLFHLGVRNILATGWEARVEDGRAMGFRVRLLETAGKATRTWLASFRPIRAARQRDTWGKARGDLHVEDGQVLLELTPNEWLEVEADFGAPIT